MSNVSELINPCCEISAGWETVHMFETINGISIKETIKREKEALKKCEEKRKLLRYWTIANG